MFVSLNGKHDKIVAQSILGDGTSTKLVFHSDTIFFFAGSLVCTPPAKIVTRGEELIIASENNSFLVVGLRRPPAKM